MKYCPNWPMFCDLWVEGLPSLLPGQKLLWFGAVTVENVLFFPKCQMWVNNKEVKQLQTSLCMLATELGCLEDWYLFFYNLENLFTDLVHHRPLVSTWDINLRAKQQQSKRFWANSF
jgi:hypothetical protein